MFVINRNIYFMNTHVFKRPWKEPIIWLKSLWFLFPVSLTLKIIRWEINRHYTIISFINLALCHEIVVTFNSTTLKVFIKQLQHHIMKLYFWWTDQPSSCTSRRTYRKTVKTILLNMTSCVYWLKSMFWRAFDKQSSLNKNIIHLTVNDQSSESCCKHQNYWLQLSYLFC